MATAPELVAGTSTDMVVSDVTRNDGASTLPKRTALTPHKNLPDMITVAPGGAFRGAAAVIFGAGCR